MNVIFTLLCILSTNEAVKLANELSRSSAFSSTSHAISAPDSVCDFSASESMWARYMNDPKHGTLVFKGNVAGQGVGNVFGGLHTALLLAMASKRELVVDYRAGGAQLSDMVPANKNGPTWKYVHYTQYNTYPCSASIRMFNFGLGNTLPEKAVNMAMDVTKYPVLCHSGNFGKLPELRGNVSAVMPGGLDPKTVMGCSMRFLFNTTSFNQELAPSAFNFVGHLRLGDNYMSRRDSRKWFIDATWGLHGNIEDAGAKVVDCMQGVARSLPELVGKDCNIIILSDSSKMKRTIESQSKGRQQPCSVRVSHGKPKHSAIFADKTAVQEMFTDLFSLSDADAAMHTSSGFSEMGAVMGPGLHHREYRLENFLHGYYELQSNGQAQQTFGDFCFSKASEAGTREDDTAHSGYPGAARTSIESVFSYEESSGFAYKEAAI